MKHFQAVVIGAGPAGYEAALELAKSGVQTLLIEQSKEQIGGVCLNEGCIPTKNYLQSADFVSKIAHFSSCGLSVDFKGMDLKQLYDKTLLLKNELRMGVMWLLEQSGVEIVYAKASFADSNHLNILEETISFDKCVIATGSDVMQISELPLDAKRIISSREVFELKTLPSSIVIVGGGPIGCEFATFFSAFGVEVTMVVRGSQLLSGEDDDVSKALLRSFKKRSINVLTSTVVLNAQVNESGVKLLVKSDIEQQIECEMVLCAAGRVPRTEALELEKAGVKRDVKGFVEINEAFQTSQKHIYAAGDCINTPGYAHTAYTEAKIAAHNIVTGESAANIHITPSTIFSNPQIASCGLNEKEAAKQGLSIDVKKAFFKTNAKAKILGDDSGFSKIIVCAQSNIVLGASVVGVEATEIIHEFVAAVEKKLTAKEFTGMIYAHPTLSEIVHYL